MTRIISSGTAATTATMDKVAYGSGYANEVIATVAARIYYTGAAWAFVASTGSDQALADISVAWDGVDYKLDIDLSALDNQFTNRPVVSVTADAGTTTGSGARYCPQGHATAVDTVIVRFVDLSDGSHVTTEGTKMSFEITMTGTID